VFGATLKVVEKSEDDTGCSSVCSFTMDIRVADLGLPERRRSARRASRPSPSGARVVRATTFLDTPLRGNISVLYLLRMIFCPRSRFSDKPTWFRSRSRRSPTPLHAGEIVWFRSSTRVETIE
jgi:hypothetical protein